MRRDLDERTRARAQTRPRFRRGRRGGWSAWAVGEGFSAGLDRRRVGLGPRASHLDAKIELSGNALPDRRRPRGSVVRGSATRRRGPPSDPAGSTGPSSRATSPHRASPARATRTLYSLSPRPRPFFAFGPISVFSRHRPKIAIKHQKKMIYIAAASIALVRAAHGACTDPGGTWDPYETRSGHGSFLQDAGAPTQDKSGVDYDLVADPAALVHFQPKDAVVADVDGASPAPKDRKILARSISYRARAHRRRGQRRGHGVEPGAAVHVSVSRPQGTRHGVPQRRLPARPQVLRRDHRRVRPDLRAFRCPSSRRTSTILLTRRCRRRASRGPQISP